MECFVQNNKIPTIFGNRDTSVMRLHAEPMLLLAEAVFLPQFFVRGHSMKIPVKPFLSQETTHRGKGGWKSGTSLKYIP